MPGRGTKLVAAVAALGVLQGCLAGFGSGKAVQSVTVTSGKIVLAGPSGFCIDTASVDEGSAGAFVLLASCSALSGSRDAPYPLIPGVLSAMVSAQADAGALAESLPGISAFLASETGRAGLSRSGDPEGVQVLQSRIEGAVLFLNIRDEAAFDGPDIEPEYWRAIFGVNGHIVTLSAMVPAGQSVAGALTTLESFLARVQQENARPQPAAPGTRQAGLFGLYTKISG